MPYRVVYTRRAQGNLNAIRPYDRRRIEARVRQQLTHEPTVETANRFRMAPNSLTQWELWVDPYRVLYDVEDDVVRVKVIARKAGERLYEDEREIDTHA